ncbi:MbtH family protein [Streptomyces sp. NPDC093097]|uniref:MbtH family protein n=1 Tax=Streptomyces sp. NPDC093097 TaxID=3366027 RepID=UPI0038191617
MSSNPFEDRDGSYFALANNEGQHSLWPVGIAVPDGWRVVHGPTGRELCLEWINTEWTDMRPLSLQARMAAADAV